MASSTIIRDIGETLKKLIISNIPDLTGEDSIIFDSPADIKPSTGSKLSIFLYQVVENGYLRNTEFTPIGPDQMKYPPLILDLVYLFTPYAQTRETEFIILERLMQVFHDTSVLKGEILQGSNLEESGNNEIRIVTNNLSSEESTELWRRFPNTDFKLSISYILTPVSIPSERQKRITRVTGKDIDLHLIGSQESKSTYKRKRVKK